MQSAMNPLQSNIFKNVTQGSEIPNEPHASSAPAQDRVQKSPSVLSIAVDGACRGNPGPSGAGISITQAGAVPRSYGFYLGTMTNNGAEYHALLIALHLVQTLPEYRDVTTLKIQSDSQLLIRQLQGVYKVKHPTLIPLYGALKTALSQYRVTLTHVLREYNTAADAAANRGVDEKTPPPATYPFLPRVSRA